MSRRPLVTIVTPCLNPGPRLRSCLDSVSAQEYPNIEHVVVDGGSTDGSQKVLADREVTWISESDDGQVDAIRKGFDLASGAILGWLNADDVLEPGAIDAVVDALEPDAGLAYGNCRLVNPDGVVTILRPPAVLTDGSFVEGNPIAQPAALFTRRALDDAGGLDASFDLAMDFDLWLRMMDAGVRCVYVPQILATFELHAASKTGSIPWSHFLEEEARACLKSGRDELAALRIGWAAVLVSERGGRIEPSRLQDEIERLSDGLPVDDPHAFSLTATGAAYSRAARFELGWGRPWGLRHLLRPEPWKDELVRRRLMQNISELLRRDRR